MNVKVTSHTLKWIAIITMIIDHTGATLFPVTSEHPEYIMFRIIGRIAFPIFAFLIVEGYRHTSNVKKYAIRLFAFALISEVPFDLAFFGRTIALEHQNVFFTLFFGLVGLWAFDILRKKNPMLAVAAIYGFGVLAQVLRTDYDIFGVILIFGLYSAASKKALYMWIAGINIVMAIMFTYYGGTYLQIFALLSIPIISLYNGQKGNQSKVMQLVFYVIYPAHIFFLYVLSQLK